MFPTHVFLHVRGARKQVTLYYSIVCLYIKLQTPVLNGLCILGQCFVPYGVHQYHNQSGFLLGGGGGGGGGGAFAPP